VSVGQEMWWPMQEPGRALPKVLGLKALPTSAQTSVLFTAAFGGEQEACMEKACPPVRER